MRKKITAVTSAMCSLVLLYFSHNILAGEFFSALQKVKKIVNLTVILPVRKTSFLYSVDYRVTVGKAKGHRLFLFKQIKYQKLAQKNITKHSVYF